MASRFVFCFIALLSLCASRAIAEEEGFIACPVSSSVSFPGFSEVIFPNLEIEIRWDPNAISATTVEIQLWELDLGLYTDIQLDTLSASTPNDGSFRWTPADFYATGEDVAEYYLWFVSNDSSDTMSSFCFYIVDDITTSAVTTDSLVLISIESAYATFFDVELWSEANPDQILEASNDVLNGNKAMVGMYGLEPNTEYHYIVRPHYALGTADWKTFVYVAQTTEETTCDHDVIAAFFSEAAYEDWPSGLSFSWCGDWETIYRYSSDPDHVFIHRDTRNGVLVLSYRGTEGNLQDWADNLSVMINCDRETLLGSDLGCDAGASVGFMSAYLDTPRETVLSQLGQAIASGCDSVIFTGHSQGAALATVAAMDVITSFPEASHRELITFGSPRV